ncbi:ceramide kinase-like protein [Dendropsophus ebraccatus]|uniref:ceramide kinase-like protein n=1 Tax=Dendropsophus ebraccatus TaxID=150705 RepID=UPI0038311DE3
MASRAPVRFPGSRGPGANSHLSPQLRSSRSEGMGESLRLPGLYRRVSAWSDKGDEPADWRRPVSVPGQLCDRCDEWSWGSDRSGAPAYSDPEERSLGGYSARLSRDSGRQAPLLRGIFQVEKRSCDVSLTSSLLLWCPILPESPGSTKVQPPPKEESIKLKDIFSVKLKRRRMAGQDKGGTLLGITVFVCIQKGHKLKENAIDFHNLSEDFCDIWFRQLKEIINGFPNRPKSLKVIINPHSHKGEAPNVYYRHVAPLFKLADIHTHVTGNILFMVTVLYIFFFYRADCCDLSFSPISNHQSTSHHKKKNKDDFLEYETKDEWQHAQGQLLNVSIMAIPCLCSMAPRGLAPNTRLNDGTMALIIVRNTSRPEFVKHLKRYATQKNQFDFPFVETHLVKEVKLRTQSNSHYENSLYENHGEVHTGLSEDLHPWNIDGDLLAASSEVHVRLHPELINLYGCNIEELGEVKAKCSCL